MKKPAAIRVNLLPKDPFLNTPLGKLLQWALSVGRYLVIFTELVVIVSFASRFTIDRQITDLNTAILQKQIIIQSHGELEQNVRSAQKKIDSYLQIEQQENVTEVFPILTAVTPQDVTLSDLEMRPGRVTLTGTTPSNLSLGIFLNNLQVSGRFNDVTVERLGTAKETNAGLGFKVDATVKKVLPQNGN
jgi:Tfp pilus assembly protein PilN